MPLGLFAAPADAVQGEAQRLMYVHVPAVLTAYAAFAVMLAANVLYLARRTERWDRLGRAAAELGAGLTALTIALGMLWARPVWGVWWTWDPRLVSTAAMLLLALGCLAVRAWPGEAGAPARRAALAGPAVAAAMPVVHFSVLWWRTLHQPPSLLKPSGAVPVDPPMLVALLAGVAAFLLAGAWVVARRYRALGTAPANPARPEVVEREPLRAAA